jgi:putative membrane protein
MQILIHILVSATLLWVVGQLLDGIEVEGAGPAVIGALMLGLANAFVRPLLVLLTLPLTVVTLGLFIFVVNALVFMLAAALVPGFRVKGFGGLGNYLDAAGHTAAHGFAEPGGVPGGYDHTDSLAREGEGNCLPDAAARSGYKRLFSFQRY